MALTQISTGGVKDDAVTAGKIPANAIGSSEIADDAVDQGAIADEAIDEARLQISNAGTNGQFLQKQSGNTGGLTWASANQYTHPNHSGEVTSTADGAQVIASNVVDEDNLKVSNSPTNGQLLSAQSGNTGGLTWTDPPASAPQIEATADGAITAGDPIIVKPDGDVKKVGLTITVLDPPTTAPSTKTQVTTDNANFHELLWIPSLKKIVFGFKNSLNGDDFEVIVGEVTDAGAFTWGSIVEVEAGLIQGSPTMAFDTNSNKVVAIWRDTNDGNKVKSVVGTISGNSISFGTVVTVESGSESSKFGLCFDSTNNKFVAVWSEDSTGYAKSSVGTVSGTSISWGTAVDVNSENSDGFSCAYDPDTQRVLLAANMQSDSQINSYVGTVSGTSISWGSETQVVSVGHDVGIVYDTENNKAVVGYRANSNDCLALVGTVTGSSTNSISWGTAASWWTSGNCAGAKIVYDDYTKRIVVQMRRDAGGGTQKLHIATGGVSGTSISFTSQTDTTDVAVYGPNETGMCMAQKGQIISVARVGSLDQDTYSWRAVAGTGATDLTTENFIGLAAATANDNATATVDVSGATNTSQSSLTPGQKYYVQGDGTIGLAADSPAVFAGTAISATKLIVNDQQPIVQPAVELLQTVTATPSTTAITFDNFVDSTKYSSYMIKISNARKNNNLADSYVEETDAFYLALRFIYSNSVYSGSTYKWNARGGWYRNSSDQSNQQDNQSHIQLQISREIASWTGQIHFGDLAEDSLDKICWGTMGEHTHYMTNQDGVWGNFYGKESSSGTGSNEKTCTGVQIYSTYGNSIKAGTFKLYGYR